MRARPLRLGIGWGLWEAVERSRANHDQRFPETRIVAEDICSDRSPTKARRIDVTVARTPLDPAVYDSQPLFDEHFIVILADSHPLAWALNRPPTRKGR